MNDNRPIVIATRGSALALAQSEAIAAQCRRTFPRLRFELKIIKTTGDRLQTAALSREGQDLPKGLFTKELEVALVQNRADLAVHSLKDLPTELPAGLKLGAVSQRADVRDVLIYRDAEFLEKSETAALQDWSPGQRQRRGFGKKLSLAEAPAGLTVGTSSTRRTAQLKTLRPDIRVVPIRGNVVTRLQKLDQHPELDALVLAAAGLERLDFRIDRAGRLAGDAVPAGLLATVLEPEVMLPCVGQGALGLEVRDGDTRIESICARLNHFNSFQCAAAERAFLQAMGGGCQSPLAAYARVLGHQIVLRAISFHDGPVRSAEGKRPVREAVALGQELAAQLRG